MFFKTGLLKSLKACNLQETPELVFSREYCEIFKNSILIEHLWWLLLCRLCKSQFKLSLISTSQQAFTCLILVIETLGKGVKCVRSQR